MTNCVSQKPFKGPHYEARFARHNSILVTATGDNRTGGWHTYFEIEPTFAPPVRLEFVNCPPEGNANDLITPFAIHIGLKAINGQKTVTIDDAGGSHHVTIHK